MRRARRPPRRWGRRSRTSPGPGAVRTFCCARGGAYRYPVAMRVANRAARAFAQQRKERGELSFQDLLVVTADLLRNESGARRDLGKRYRHVLVDEFQDTDPLQAEILLLLTSDPEEGTDWRKVVPRPGALFVVGDPKQSIYRFRRADISLYDFVKKRFEAFGDVLLLAANFRSLGAIEALVKGVFDLEDRFARNDTDRQAAFAPLRVQPWVRGEGDPGPGLLAAYNVIGGKHDEAAWDDAERIATAIARRVAAGDRAPWRLHGTDPDPQVPGGLRACAGGPQPSGGGVGRGRGLRGRTRRAPCSCSGALADPAHEVRALGVLSGPLFGITLDQLVEYRDGRGQLPDQRARRGRRRGGGGPEPAARLVEAGRAGSPPT